MRTKLLMALLGLALAGCAHVPKESVELSATIGRDLATVHASHRELAQILFSRMRQDINQFVDEVYAPFIIDSLMTRQHKLAQSSDANDRKKSLLLAINKAFQPGASAELQSKVLRGMGILVRKIQTDVDEMRAQLLAPLNAQEQEVLGSIDRAYQQLHYANSIVTGHLSSVLKVHETQSQVLAEFGVERDLRRVISTNLSNASEKIADLVESAGQAENKLDMAEEVSEKLKEAINELKNNLGK